MLYFFSPLLSAQELVVGGGLALGSGWEIERLPLNAPPTDNTGVAGDNGYELYGFIGYRIDRFTLGIRPSLMSQQTTVYRLMGDDGAMSFREKIYPIAMLLPIRVEITFGEQRFRPLLGLGAGFLLDLNNNDQETGPQPAPVLPFLEVAVGVDIRLQQWHLRPEINIRNGTGELFHAGRNPSDRIFGGQRWGYASIGVVVSK
ncbi:hypothetical protein [Neolewinella persica]|uniref:hypothetical protein n=1 Tax=Neolewinella persica TaxID=70998 RepID=UPI0012F7AB69|nr:hypothetical protein [Neolewinella persica]